MSGITRRLPLAQIELVEMDALEVLPVSIRTGGSSARRCAPQFTNSMPSLNVALVARTKSFSLIPSIELKLSSGGMVASPTPTSRSPRIRSA